MVVVTRGYDTLRSNSLRGLTVNRMTDCATNRRQRTERNEEWEHRRVKRRHRRHGLVALRRALKGSIDPAEQAGDCAG